VKTQSVQIPGSWTFDPKTIEVTAGSTVTWTNHGGVEHTVTFDALPFDASLAPGTSANYTFEKAGTYAYYCRFHRPDMEGTVIVDPAPSTT
jgi:plastocyanin